MTDDLTERTMIALEGRTPVQLRCSECGTTFWEAQRIENCRVATRAITHINNKPYAKSIPGPRIHWRYLSD